MDLLDKRRVGVDDAIRLQHAMDFLDHRLRLQHMFEHGLNPDAVEHCITERQEVTIRHHIGIRRCVDVGSDNLDIRIRVKCVRSCADSACRQ